MSNLSKRAIKIHETLLKVFGEPTWRDPLPPVDELVSTILSQNTNDTNRDRAFHGLRVEFGGALLSEDENLCLRGEHDADLAFHRARR